MRPSHTKGPLHEDDCHASIAPSPVARCLRQHNANVQLERCDKTLGTLTIVEETNQPWLQQFTQEYRMQSTVPVLRMIIQQSNCFAVVERGRAFNNMQTERALMQSGELRKASNIGKGQMVAADYTVTPSVSFSARGTGGTGALIGGSLKSNEASTMLLLSDNRSGIQLAAAEGSAKNWDYGAMGAMFNGGFGGASGFTASALFCCERNNGRLPACAGVSQTTDGRKIHVVLAHAGIPFLSSAPTSAFPRKK